MQPAKKFTTKTGYCHVLEDGIVFTPRGFLGQIGDLTIEGRMNRILVGFSLLDLIVLYFSYKNYVDGQVIWAATFGLIGIYIGYGVITGLNNSIEVGI